MKRTKRKDVPLSSEGLPTLTRLPTKHEKAAKSARTLTPEGWLLFVVILLVALAVIL